MTGERVVPDKPGQWWLCGVPWPVAMNEEGVLVINRGYYNAAGFVEAMTPVDDPRLAWDAPVITPEEADALRQRAETAERELRALQYRVVEHVGEVVGALGINPPGEDAVANFEQVVEAIDSQRVRMEAAEAELAQLRTRYAELRRLAGELADGVEAEDSSPGQIAAAAAMRAHLESEERS